MSADSNHSEMTSAIPKLPQAIKSTIVLFPGQGSQYVGMARNLCKKGADMFEMANQILGYNLLKLCQEGPEEELNKTIHSQPAMFVSSLAAVENLNDRCPDAIRKCVATAGFSVGEFAALVFAKTMTFTDALRLIKLRAEVTNEIGESVPSGMMTTVLGNDAKIKQACVMAKEYCVRSGLPVEESICSVANHLFPHAKVLGGHQKALEFLDHNGKNFGIRRTKRLAVSAAFHTKLMKPAKDPLKNAIGKIEIKDPTIEVYSNVDGLKYSNADNIKQAIPHQVYLPVLWEQTLQNLYAAHRSGPEDYPLTFECGPGNNMVTMLGMVNLKAKQLAYNIEP